MSLDSINFLSVKYNFYFLFSLLFLLLVSPGFYTAHNNIWNFEMVRASLNLIARIAMNSIYFVRSIALTKSSYCLHYVYVT